METMRWYTPVLVVKQTGSYIQTLEANEKTTLIPPELMVLPPR